jgi:hypothetical protein
VQFLSGALTLVVAKGAVKKFNVACGRFSLFAWRWLLALCGHNFRLLVIE